MFGMVKNGAISAKLKAKRGKLLNNDDYLALCSLGSVPAIAEYLKKTEGYKGFIEDDCRGTIHRDSLENMIYLSLIYDYESLYSFSKGPVRDFLLLYYLKREIWAIKSALYAVANKDRSIHLDIPARHKKIDTEAIETAKSKNELAEALHGTPYYDIVKEEGSIFEIETRLDKYYFDMMSDTVKNAGKEDKAAATAMPAPIHARPVTRAAEINAVCTTASDRAFSAADTFPVNIIIAAIVIILKKEKPLDKSVLLRRVFVLSPKTKYAIGTAIDNTSNNVMIVVNIFTVPFYILNNFQTILL
jgi:hypothetical protein